MDILVRAEIPSDSGLGEDKFVNTFAFHSPDTLGGSDLLLLETAVYDFYTSTPSGGLTSLSNWFSPDINNSADAFVIKSYDITGMLDGVGSMGGPIHESLHQFDASSGGGAGLPAEVAVVLTLHGIGAASAPVETADGADADSLRDRPKQRHTGRLFLGPLNVNTLANVDNQTRPASNIRDTARLAAAELYSDAFADAGALWCVWSRKNAAMYPIERASVDNAFDTVRSRGPAATLRTYIDVP